MPDTTPVAYVQHLDLPEAAAELKAIAGDFNSFLDRLGGSGRTGILDRGLRALRKLEAMQRAIADSIEDGRQ
jgi:hypothetical protein